MNAGATGMDLVDSVCGQSFVYQQREKFEYEVKVSFWQFHIKDKLTNFIQRKLSQLAPCCTFADFHFIVCIFYEFPFFGCETGSAKFK